MNQVIWGLRINEPPPPPPPFPHLTNFRFSKQFLVYERLDCNSVSAGSRQIISWSRMFIHSDLYLADTNQHVAYSVPGETIDENRIANCNWWPRQEKQLVLMFVHRWRGAAKWLTSQGGFGRTPRTPPGSAPAPCSRNYFDAYWNNNLDLQRCDLILDDLLDFFGWWYFTVQWNQWRPLD